MRKYVCFEDEGEAEIIMDGMNRFFTEIHIKLNCYYDSKITSFTSPTIKFEFTLPVEKKILDELKVKCNEGKQFKIIISQPSEYPKMLEGCILDNKCNSKGSAISLIQTRK